MTFLRIPGKPIAKARARGGRNGFYTPKTTVDAEARIRAAAIEAGIGKMTGPLELVLRCSYAPPKSWSKKRQAEAMGTWKTSKPDTDNLLKLVKDALNGIAYEDDAQVVLDKVAKFYGQKDETTIVIRPAPDRVPMGAL